MAVKSTEVSLILRNSPLERIIAFNQINKDDKLRNELVGFLNEILASSEAKIARSAGVARSVDQLVDIGIDQAFDKGRISMAVLLHSLIKNSPAELEHREELKKRRK